MVPQDHLARNVVRILSIQRPTVLQSEKCDTGKIFGFLTKAYSGKELKRFCRDSSFFDQVVASFADTDSVGDIADKLIEYVENHHLWADFFREVRQQKPKLYEHFYPYEERIQYLIEKMEPLRYKAVLDYRRWPSLDDVLERALTMTVSQQDELFWSRTPHRAEEEFGLVVGAGVRVDEESVVTCTHAVARAYVFTDGRYDEDVLQIDFPCNPRASNRPWNVELCISPPPDAGFEDQCGDGVVVYCLSKEQKPHSPGFVHLVDLEEISNHPLEVFGFASGHLSGRWVTVTDLRRSGMQGFMQIRDKEDFLTLPGFTGAPVWAKDVNAVVGINVAGHDATGQPAAFIVPSGYLQKALRGRGHLIASRPSLHVALPPAQSPAIQLPTQPSVAQSKGTARGLPRKLTMPDIVWREFLHVADATSILIPGSSDALKLLQREVGKVVSADQGGSSTGDVQSVEHAFDGFHHYMQNSLTPQQRDTATVKKLRRLVEVMEQAILLGPKTATGTTVGG